MEAAPGGVEIEQELALLGRSHEGTDPPDRGDALAGTHDHDVAGIDQCHQGVVDDALRPGPHDHLVVAVGEPVLALELVAFVRLPCERLDHPHAAAELDRVERPVDLAVLERPAPAPRGVRLSVDVDPASLL